MRLDHIFKNSGEKSSMGAPKDSCLYCGKTKEWHDLATEEVKKIERPASDLAAEWLTSKGFKTTQFYELGKHLLTKYIEDSRV